MPCHLNKETTMVKIQRANTVLDIEDEDVERYVNLGYNVIDNRGNILREAIPNLSLIHI